MTDIFAEKDDDESDVQESKDLDEHATEVRETDPLYRHNTFTDRPLQLDNTHQFLDKKIIGVFKFAVDHTLIVYADGSV